ncbi:YtxH domain-containing protein [Bacillus sp. DTU_2020_1000418_1_SI_GHA_SEK_038]|uniref:YtxH domain-containing protein n=1 Tax=Bacillus sp. DTU_2020_1000418_1_SI_GHA_SEK_038 TaxID=3077585 RepID=UPI0028E4A10D|nr:YtxH domain-containing protein [Bacillus sp. DTU_2020_1000418_1_SI_GHA_SEK_038]WNS76767.1 YtxH domain-containing protein [Bacillus sp. DTU_2020_1000418_1_SI_GHA_SEK_038]
MKAKSLLIGFFIGGSASGISTLLTAPNSGKETRQNLIENVKNIQKQMAELKSQIIDLKDTAVRASKEGKVIIAEFSSDVITMVDEWKRDIQSNQQILHKEIHVIEEAISDLENSLDLKNYKK